MQKKFFIFFKYRLHFLSSCIIIIFVKRISPMENFLQVIPLINYLYSPHRKNQWLPRWFFLMQISNQSPSKSLKLKHKSISPQRSTPVQQSNTFNLSVHNPYKISHSYDLRAMTYPILSIYSAIYIS